jgi:hypothetical protein
MAKNKDFQIGDKVICNGFSANGKPFFANGKHGFIDEKDESGFTVIFDDCSRGYLFSNEMIKA